MPSRDIKKTIAGMSWKDKIEYLWTYYKWVLAVAAVVILIICIVVSSIMNKSLTTLYGGTIINAELSAEGETYLTDGWFELFVALLKLCIGANLSENKSVPLSPQLREEVRKLDQYDEDTRLLCKYHIGTAEELSAFREETIQKIHALVQERNGIYNKIRRAAEPEKTQLKEQAKVISQQIAPLRKEFKCADRIWDRSLDKVKTLLEQERQMETQVMDRYKERSNER